MTNYIDGFVFPISRQHLDDYKTVAEKIATIWKEYGALAYFEFVGDDLHLEGTHSFADLVDLKDDEVVIFGWVVFPAQDVRQRANQKVPMDPRMAKLMAPLTNPDRLIFDAGRMIYGGFKPFIQSTT